VKAICFLLPLVLTITAEAGELYKWVDENGVVHYSQTPPPNTESSAIEIQEDYVAPPTAGESVYADAIEQQAARNEERRRLKEEQKEEREAREREESTSQEACARAIHYLSVLDKQCPVFYDAAGILRAQCPPYYYAVEGERSYIDDNERQELVRHYLEVVFQCREAGRY
jgi:hypothetical protein